MRLGCVHGKAPPAGGESAVDDYEWPSQKRESAALYVTVSGLSSTHSLAVVVVEAMHCERIVMGFVCCDGFVGVGWLGLWVWAGSFEWAKSFVCGGDGKGEFWGSLSVIVNRILRIQDGDEG